MTPNAIHLFRALGWLILAILLGALALVAEGQTLPEAPKPHDRLETSLLILDTSSRTLDCYSTQRMLGRGYHELLLPKAIATHPAAMATYSAGTVALDWWVAHALERHRHRRLARLVTAIDLAQDAPWAIHNLFLKKKP